MPLRKSAPPWLAVIDMQVAFRDRDSVWACDGYTEIEPVITKLTRSFNDRTLYTRFVPDQHERGQWARYYDHWPTMRQSAAAHVWNRTIEPHADAPVVSLPTFSKWGADLSTVVGDSAPLVMCGVATECCILATAIAAADDGREVIVLSDACRGATNDYHQQALSVMHQMAPLITVIDSAELSQWIC